jgi:holo-[acyl-carrier protein] synthase
MRSLIVGTGIDVVEIERVERALARHGRRFEERVFHPREIAGCRGHRRAAPFYAQRFAAKEALMKAVGTGWARGVRWVDIEVVGRAGAFEIELHGEVADVARRRGVARIHLGLGRSRSLALAAVLLDASGP